jgi:hypothetical protein
MSTDPSRHADGPHGGPGGASGAPGEPSEEELRAAYEAELDRITSADMMLQAAVSLVNIGGRRLGLGGAPGAPAGAGRDLAQVRDAIDGVRALLEILERSRPQELKPLRDALSQLQMAYARETQAVTPPPDSAGRPEPGGPGAPAGGREKAADGDVPGGDVPDGDMPNGAPGVEDRPSGPGPAQSSGRLWVPGS